MENATDMTVSSSSTGKCHFRNSAVKYLKAFYVFKQILFEATDRIRFYFQNDKLGMNKCFEKHSYCTLIFNEETNALTGINHL